MIHSSVTASHTTTPELFTSCGIHIQPVNTWAVVRPDTKVGTHNFITKIDHLSDPLGQKL